MSRCANVCLGWFLITYVAPNFLIAAMFIYAKRLIF